MFGLFNKSKAISTKLVPFEQKRFLAHVVARKKSVSEVLREAVTFYLDNYDCGKECFAPDHENHGTPSAKSELLAQDYDDLSSEPRPNRLFWGG